MTDVVFGNVTPSATAIGGFAPGYQFANKYTLSGGDPAAVLKDITVDMSATGSHTNDYIAAVWRDVAGSPGALVGYGMITPIVGPFSEQFLSVLGTGGSITLVDAGGVMADGDYWIGMWQSAGSAYNFQYSGGGLNYKSVGGAAPTNPFGSVDGIVAFGIVANATVTFGGGCTDPTIDVDPNVTGDNCPGDVLTSDEGTWNDVDSMTTYDFQWQEDCGSGFINLVGQTFSTLLLTSDDSGCDVRCVVTATNECGPAEANSNTITVQSEPVNIVTPVATGSPFVGHTIVADTGTWDFSSSETFQWQIDCGGGFIDLVGETTDSYTLVDGDIGCNVACLITAHGDCGEASSYTNIIGPVEANVPAATRFCTGPTWRFVVTDLDSQVLTFLDRLATNRTAVFTLNGPAVATGVVPSDAPEISINHTDGEPFLTEGTRLLYGFREENVAGQRRWVVRYAGMILQIEDIADSDNASSHYTAFDPLKYLFSRPVQTIEGNPVGVNGLSFTQTRVDVIVGTLLLNTIVNNGNTYIDMGASYGGTGFYAGTIESLPQIDINFQQGLSVGDAFKQLTDQNYCDILLDPVWDPENRPGTLVDLSIYAQAGAVQEDAVFAWDKPSRSLVGISRLLEGTARADKVRYFAGQGGSVGSVTETDAVSVAKYGEYWSQQFWPGQKLLAGVTALAQAALELQKNGKETVTISPIPGCTPLPFQEYYLGDRVPVYASSRFRQKIPNGAVQYQRIYGMPIDIEDDSTEMIKQMLTSELQ